jgi:DNA-binding SARP family transcriptional activator/tetratricopeptide (TPR) repeat protein
MTVVHQVKGAGMAVEFRLLGDIEMNVDGTPVTIGYAQLRSVLAVLLVEANRTVPVDQLVDRIWRDRRMPHRPRGAVQHNVTLLRQTLAAARDVTIAWRSPGYRLTADPDTIDLHRFRALVSQARTAGDEQAVALLEQALRLWRGEPFSGLDSGWLVSLRATLAQQHLAARLDLNDAELRRGRHAGMVAELADWVRRYPLDERLAGQYMTALCRDGQQARALAHFEQLRGLLVEQLGADPSAPLRELHRRILVADPVLAGTPAVSAPSAVPRQLPARPRLFFGREREIARLTAALDEAGGSGGALMICAIGGPGGIGKTWLALHWAHQRLHRFPDGQLHINLRGFDPSGEPVAPEAALREFLEALGVPATAIPSGVDARAARYRSLVAGRRMLILLDNARDAAQVVPLLPGSPTCCVLVTSRQRLTGLVVANGAHPVELDVLAGSAAGDLLAGHLGRDRVAREPDAAARLLSFCAGLPLAISIVAARAAVQPGLALSALVDELRALPALAAMDTGDSSTSLRATLSWSHRALPAAPAEAFGLLGLAPGPDIGVAAAASLAGTSDVDIRTVLRCLQDASLVRQQEPGRFRMHDLVRRYAADSAGPSAEAPLRRLVDHYLHTAFAAARLLDPHRQPIRLAEPAPGAHPAPVADEPAALDWLATEHANLIACQRMAGERDWHAPVWQLAWTLDTFHWRRGLLQRARAMWQAGLAAAEALDDTSAQTWCHQRLGNACAPLGRHSEALHHLRRALALAERAGECADQAHTHHILAWLWEEMGDDHRALEHANRAVCLFQAVGRPAWEANALNTAGWYHARLGHHEQAWQHGTAALALFQGGLDPQGEAATLDTLGYLARHTGQLDQSLTYYGRALALFRDLGYSYEEANTLAHLGRTHQAIGRPDAARSALRQALELYQAQHRESDAERVRVELALLD